MLKKTLILLTTNLLCGYSNAKDNFANDAGHFSQKTESVISFTENKGQVHNQYYETVSNVLFSGSEGDFTFHLKNNGISYQLSKIDEQKKIENIQTKEINKIICKSTIYRIDLNWINSNKDFQIIKGATCVGVNNYYLENCPEGIVDVKSYENVTYSNIYDGIDLKWYQSNGHLKYDFILASGANYKQIKLEFKGANTIKVTTKGELIIETPFGNVIENAPVVFQNGKKLKSNWVVNENIVGFNIKNLNPNEPYIIDPEVRAWGTYYGGNSDDSGNSCINDANGNVYLAGITNLNSGSTIATTGAHQTTFLGNYDSFLVKFDPNGIRQWGTYYGGAGFDQAISCAADLSGNIYMVGTTTSSGNSLSTSGAHQTNFVNQQDAFLVKFNSSGIRQWGSYYGGSGVDEGISCSVDAGGNVFMAGSTNSSGPATFIATTGSYQSGLASGGYDDAFLVKFNSSGVRLWGTYYGNGLGTFGYSCITDPSGNIYLTGATQGPSSILATVGAHQVNFGGNVDAFLVKFNTNGVRQWSTYYGGTGYDSGTSIVTDGSGNAYIAGYTSSSNGSSIATSGSYKSAYAGGANDAFLVKFNSSGIRQWATYYGGVGDDKGYFCKTDASNNVCLGGNTDSNFSLSIVTSNAFQYNYGGGISDAYLVMFNSFGSRQWGTYYGGSGTDIGNACSIDTQGNIFMAGSTNSSGGNEIASSGSHQSVFGGNINDAFLIKFIDCTVPFAPSGANQNICANTSATISSSSGTATINWYASSTSTVILATGNTFVTPILSVGTYTYYSEAFSCAPSSTRKMITVTVGVCTNIEDVFLENENLGINPNPNNGEFSMQVLSGGKYKIINLIGQSVREIELLEGKQNINLQELSQGIYYLIGNNVKYKIVVVK